MIMINMTKRNCNKGDELVTVIKYNSDDVNVI